MNNLSFKTVIILFLFSLTSCINYTSETDRNLGIYNEFFETYHVKMVSKNVDSFTYFGNDGNSRLKINKFHNVMIKDVDYKIQEKMFFINTLYREIHSPYPGQISNKIGCSDEFTPIKFNNTPYDYYQIYASDRLTYGVCSWDLVKYKSILYFYYCEDNKELFQLELFINTSKNLEDYTDNLKKLRCE